MGALETMPSWPVNAIRRIMRAYGILGPAIVVTAIILIIVGVVWAALHDKLF
jgi:hypothetical protein